MNSLDPHAKASVVQFGAPLSEAIGVMILLHGRGGSAQDILSLARSLYDPRLCYLAPQAANHLWYPNSFLAPRETNEPDLSSALRKINSLITEAAEAGIPTERIFIGGFSQGASLSTEFVASHPARYAGLMTFTGGLLGPLGTDISHEGDLAGTPALMFCGDPDPYIPWPRVEESAVVLRAMGADVTTYRYPGRPHIVTAEELALAAEMVKTAIANFNL
ncbi:alpha/beta hydrolase [Granulicella tundricola]|uniref:Phospholipase/Carboxylesterase n=1 Tax=Granulicella tundricola (strain ATCC BAA-1859 / DSM 23138 / MP5ACTX9) TaxID=1198114 RepID=E8X2C0_GRATM|nr:phospholipase [Granulicella tundricola]ADW68052.1 phospholipase/Carboxylesterase [Granulicella tundricola MP5ACTX9]